MKLLALMPLVAAASASVSIGLQKIRGGPGTGRAHPLLRRGANNSSTTFVQSLINNVTAGGYFAEIAVGTPPQKQTLIVDTGSSDLWVVGHDADLCTSRQLQREYQETCDETYNPNKSSTYEMIEEGGFAITYLDTSSSEGDFIADNVHIGGTEIQGLQMGCARKIVRGSGIMGVGFNASESTSNTYPNIMDEFVLQELIQTKAFSLYLNALEADTGSILFGGVDTDKFVGELVSLPILPSRERGSSGGSGSTATSYTTFAIAMSGMKATRKSDGKIFTVPFSDSVPAILDSGTTLSYLPDALASPLYQAVGAYTDNKSDNGYTYVDCDDSTATSLEVSFVFGRGVNITVPASQLVLDVFEGQYHLVPATVPFKRPCLFGLQNMDTFEDTASEGTTSLALLGDTFLRSAYVVYSLDHNEIALAPANLNSTTSNVVELEQAADGIPTLTGVASQGAPGKGTSTGTASGTASGTAVSGASSGSPTSGSRGGDSGDTVTVTASPTPSSSSSSSSSSSAASAVLPQKDFMMVSIVASVFAAMGSLLVLA